MTDNEYAPSPTPFVRDQVERFEASSGQAAADVRGAPIVVLSCRGARTGKLRKVPVMRVEHEGEYAVIASYGGAVEHPVWYHNLIACPQVRLQDGAEVTELTARLVSGPERDIWWSRAVEAWPAYADYQLRTDRIIPVFVLASRTTTLRTPDR